MKSNCLTWDLIVRAADKELLPLEEQRAMAHLESCADCRHEFDEIRRVSAHIQSTVDATTITAVRFERQRLEAELEKQDAAKPARHAPERVMLRFGWGMAIAATLALGIIIAPKPKIVIETPPVAQAANTVSSAIEVDGETFIALPYSNPDLPASAPRIVQMQVPVSSLSDIGISLEHIASEVSGQDRSVLADVLLGADGQPLGVHVVSWE
jgi:hypothetical protein